MAHRWYIAIRTLALATAGASFWAATPAQAQAMGAYEGTITISGTMKDSRARYEARIKVVLPIGESSASSVLAGLDVTVPDGTVEITQYEETRGSGGPGEGGEDTGSERCTLKSPAKLPVQVQGVLAVDLRKSVYDFSVSIVSQDDMELSCINTRSGASTRTEGFAISTGTGVPGSQSENRLPFTDSAHLSGQFTLDPTEYTQGEFGPIQQKWEFHRLR